MDITAGGCVNTGHVSSCICLFVGFLLIDMPSWLYVLYVLTGVGEVADCRQHCPTGHAASVKLICTRLVFSSAYEWYFWYMYVLYVRIHACAYTDKNSTDIHIYIDAML